MTRDDVIDAAFRVWGQEFYKTTSLTELAETLRVSKPALYRHFSGKQALLEAMEGCFYDDYTAAIKPMFQGALKNANWQERLLSMVRFITSYFACHRDYLIYFLVRLHSNKDHRFFLLEAMAKRGIRFVESAFRSPTDRQYPSALFLASLTAVFGVAEFHRKRSRFENGERNCSLPEQEPSKEEAGCFTEATAERVRFGLRFDPARINALSFERLEALSAVPHTPPDPLLKAVAEVVAEEGLWKASMETVAKRSGLSKSGLYAHFKSKKDMLSRFFMTEFERVAECTIAHIALSDIREEQLYLAILSIAGYFRARPEIVVALDWVRIQRLKLDLSLPPRLYDFFADLKPEPASDGGVWENIPHWIPFLLGVLLMEPKKQLKPNNKSLRKMFRFISLGLEGLDKY